jgi:hypothetical protein
LTSSSVEDIPNRTSQPDPAQKPTQRGTGETIQTIRVWLNSFIPADLGVPVESGVHAGKTMLKAPTPAVKGYLTDQRGFSDALNAHSRMHSEIEIDLVNLGVVTQVHRCDPTVEIGQNDKVTCEETADTDHMKFGSLHVQQNESGRLTLEIDLDGASKNACLNIADLRLSPNLDYNGTLTISVDRDKQQALVWFKGHIEIYPAFEMYASCNGRQPVVLFRLPPEPGSSPTNLIGPPAREVYGEAALVG